MRGNRRRRRLAQPAPTKERRSTRNDSRYAPAQTHTTRPADDRVKRADSGRDAQKNDQGKAQVEGRKRKTKQRKETELRKLSASLTEKVEKTVSKSVPPDDSTPHVEPRRESKTKMRTQLSQIGRNKTKQYLKDERKNGSKRGTPTRGKKLSDDGK